MILSNERIEGVPRATKRNGFVAVAIAFVLGAGSRGTKRREGERLNKAGIEEEEHETDN